MRSISGPGTAASISGLNVLRFQLQTLNKNSPAGVHSVSSASNLITDYEHGGVFMISNSKFADEWLHNMLIDGAILPSFANRPTNSSFVKTHQLAGHSATALVKLWYTRIREH